MVFVRFAAGLTVGLTLPLMCHENVYLLIATSFLRPHLKYRMEAASRHKDIAISTDSLDSYLIDVAKSFVLFFILIGPVVYKTHYLGEDLTPKSNEEEVNILEVEDRAVTILNRIHPAGQASQAGQAGQENEAETPEEEGPRVTFADYERLMQTLEEDNRVE